jgi:hypothetical protein
MMMAPLDGEDGGFNGLGGLGDLGAAAPPAVGARFPTMSDGRMFTDYSARCGLTLPSGMSCHDYKDGMIKNAEDKMRADRAGAAAAVGGVWCAETPVPGIELIVECNDRACAFQRTGAEQPVGISTDNTRLQQ